MPAAFRKADYRKKQDKLQPRSTIQSSVVVPGTNSTTKANGNGTTHGVRTEQENNGMEIDPSQIDMPSHYTIPDDDDEPFEDDFAEGEEEEDVEEEEEEEERQEAEEREEEPEKPVDLVDAADETRRAMDYIGKAADTHEHDEMY